MYRLGHTPLKKPHPKTTTVLEALEYNYGNWWQRFCAGWNRFWRAWYGN
jgi:hypothetical protein